MRHPDYDRAFHETPEYIRSAIELGFVKGKKAMKARRKVTSALSIAAAVVVLLGAAAFGAIQLGAPRPDGMLPGRPLSGPTVTEAPAPTAAPTVDPHVTPVPEQAAETMDAVIDSAATVDPEALTASPMPENATDPTP